MPAIIETLWLCPHLRRCPLSCLNKWICLQHVEPNKGQLSLGLSRSGSHNFDVAKIKGLIQHVQPAKMIWNAQPLARFHLNQTLRGLGGKTICVDKSPFSTMVLSLCDPMVVGLLSYIFQVPRAGVWDRQATRENTNIGTWKKQIERNEKVAVFSVMVVR